MDANLDGFLDAIDYAKFKHNFEQTGVSRRKALLTVGPALFSGFYARPPCSNGKIDVCRFHQPFDVSVDNTEPLPAGRVFLIVDGHPIHRSGLHGTHLAFAGFRKMNTRGF
jgi:hypothetical protein